MSSRFLEDLPLVYIIRLRRFINTAYISSVYDECIRFYIWGLNCPFITYPQSISGVDSSNLISCREDKCHLWNSLLSECEYVLQEQQRVHTHRQHWHPLKHACNEGYLNTSCGKDIGEDSPSKAVILLLEFMGNEDVDGDGQIYGKDFKIDPADLECPTMLKTIKDHPLLTATVIMTWQDYLDSVI